MQVHMGRGSLNFMKPKEEGHQKCKLGFGEDHTIVAHINVHLNKNIYTNNLFGSYKGEGYRKLGKGIKKLSGKKIALPPRFSNERQVPN